MIDFNVKATLTIYTTVQVRLSLQSNEAGRMGARD